MFVESIIFKILGDGDLSVYFPSNLRVFFCPYVLLSTSKANSAIELKQTCIDPIVLIKSKNMEQVTYAIGNPTALLIERIFWLCLSCFFVLAIITSIIRGLKES